MMKLLLDVALPSPNEKDVTHVGVCSDAELYRCSSNFIKCFAPEIHDDICFTWVERFEISFRRDKNISVPWF